MGHFPFEKKLLVFSWFLYLLSLMLPAVMINDRSLFGFETVIIAWAGLLNAQFSVIGFIMSVSTIGNMMSVLSVVLIFLFEPSKKQWLFYLLILCALLLVAAIINIGLLLDSHFVLHLGAYLWLLSLILLFMSFFIAYQELKNESSI